MFIKNASVCEFEEENMEINDNKSIGVLIDGHLISQGKATYRGNRQRGRALTVEVSIKETYVFEKMVRVFKALVDDEYTPKWIKEKINQLILDEL